MFVPVCCVLFLCLYPSAAYCSCVCTRLLRTVLVFVAVCCVLFLCLYPSAAYCSCVCTRLLRTVVVFVPICCVLFLCLYPSAAYCSCVCTRLLRTTVTDYDKRTKRALFLLDHEKINNDLIELVIEWIVDGDHEVCVMKIKSVVYCCDTKPRQIVSSIFNQFLISSLCNTMSAIVQVLFLNVFCQIPLVLSALYNVFFIKIKCNWSIKFQQKFLQCQYFVDSLCRCFCSFQKGARSSFFCPESGRSWHYSHSYKAMQRLEADAIKTSNYRPTKLFICLFVYFFWRIKFYSFL